MLKWVLNSDTYVKAGNSVFELVNSYFTGTSINKIKDPEDEFQSVQDEDANSTYEWELHQGVSDIAIKDIKLTFKLLVPSSLIKTLNKVHRRILLYFFLDELEDEIISAGGTSVSNSEVFNNHRIITLVVNTKNIIHDKIIWFNDWFKDLVYKLEIFLNIRDGEKTYHLIGNFSPRAYDHLTGYYTQAARGPDTSKLRSFIPFHKRN